MRFIYLALIAALVGGTALAAVATLAGATAHRIGAAQTQSLRQGSMHHGPGFFHAGRMHSGGGFSGGK